MSIRKLLLFVPLFFLATFMDNIPVLCNEVEEEDDLLQGINSYRQSINVPPLANNDRAQCLANEIAHRLDEHSCGSSTYGINLVPGTGPQSTDYGLLLSKCKIHLNHTTDSVILPVCIHDLVPTLVLRNYTQSQYATYLSNSNYTGIGVETEDDWMVVVLTTNSPTGDLAGSSVGRTDEDGVGLIVVGFRTIVDIRINVSLLTSVIKKSVVLCLYQTDTKSFPTTSYEFNL